MKKRWLRALLGGALALGTGTTATAQYPMGAPCPMPPGLETPHCDPGCEPHCPKFWVRAEYLLWQVRGMDTPPLLTSGPLDVLGFSGAPGVLGQPTTQILLGAEALEFDVSSGGRATVGWWFDCSECLGIEGSYLELFEQDFDSTFASAGTPGTIPLSVPFFNLLQGVEDTIAVAFPGEGGFSGSATTHLRTELWAAEVNGLLNFISAPGWRVNFLAGVRYLNLKESLRFTTNTEFLPPSQSVFETLDHFECENTFYGGQIGLRGDFRARIVSVEITGKVGYGQMERETTIVGQLNTNAFSGDGSFQTIPGGYFALPTNIGYYKDNRFAVVSEVTAQVGWHPWEGVRAFAGYTMLYATHVARPGDQIDRSINTTQAPAITGDPNNVLQGPAAPLFRNIDASWWAQGVNLGLEFRF